MEELISLTTLTKKNTAAVFRYGQCDCAALKKKDFEHVSVIIVQLSSLLLIQLCIS